MGMGGLAHGGAQPIDSGAFFGHYRHMEYRFAKIFSSLIRSRRWKGRGWSRSILTMPWRSCGICSEEMSP
jgi:hypothetical protein